MKVFKTAAITLLILAASFAFSQRATASAPTHDCTSGCFIITCHRGTCTVFHCSGASGCVVTGTFPAPPDMEKSAGAAPGDLSDRHASHCEKFNEVKGLRGITLSGDEAYAFKTCNEGVCTVWQHGMFDGAKQPTIRPVISGVDLDHEIRELTRPGRTNLK